MKVFVIGATGFIGLPVAQALVRGGHIVYGLARTDEKAKLLATEEIIPIPGDATDSADWEPIIATIDVVIECLGGTFDLPKLSLQVLTAVADAAQKLRPSGAPKVSYIYTSGSWVHGDDRETIVTDTTPITNPTPLVAWRPAFEQQIVNHAVLNGIIVRPGVVYGRSGSLIGMLFAGIPSGKVTWPGTPGGRFSAVHTDDLANFYSLAAEKSSLIGGKIFDVSNDATESVDEILAKAAKLGGLKGYEYKEPTNPFEVALGLTVLVRPYLARALLGWTPKKASIIDGLDIYYEAWKALTAK